MAKNDKAAKELSEVKPQVVVKEHLKKAQAKAEVKAEVQESPTALDPSERVYAGEQTIEHDLYKLRVANMQKNKSYTKELELVPMEHTHFYHTYDSNGREQKTCSAIGGHTHIMEQVVNEDGHIVIKCGPPIVKHKGKWIEIPYDKHTHAIQYIKSEKAQKRVINADAQKAFQLYDAPIKGDILA
jgi:hypothetical protein